MVSALGHNRQDESGVVSVSRSATGSCERLQRRGPSRGLYGESGLASLPSSHTNSSTTDRSFTLLLLPSLSPCILLCTFLHSITRTFRSFLFSAAPVLSFHHVVSQAAPLAALRAASCSQRCKQRNRADCGCQQWHLRVHQLPGGEGQEVHSRHSCQWYVAAKLCVQCTFSFSFPSTPVLLAWTAPDSSNFRSCTSRVPRLRLGRSGY